MQADVLAEKPKKYRGCRIIPKEILKKLKKISIKSYL